MTSELITTHNSFLQSLQHLNPELDPVEVSILANKILDEITIGLTNGELPALVRRKPDGDIELRILTITAKNK